MPFQPFAASNNLAIPGEPTSSGILDPGHGVTIYPASAGEALSAFADEPQRWLPLSWDLDEAKGALFPVGVRLVVKNECGALADIAGVIATEGSNIDGLTMSHKTPDFREMNLHIEVRDREHLSRILHRLQSLGSVAEAVRSTH